MIDKCESKRLTYNGQESERREEEIQINSATASLITFLDFLFVLTYFLINYNFHTNFKYFTTCE